MLRKTILAIAAAATLGAAALAPTSASAWWGQRRFSPPRCSGDARLSRK
jgi:hypothetical protein